MVWLNSRTVSFVNKLSNTLTNKCMSFWITWVCSHWRANFAIQKFNSVFSILANDIWFYDFWVYQWCKNLSVKCNETLTHSLRISNVAWWHFIEFIVMWSIWCFDFFQDFLTSHWNCSSNCILALLHILRNSLFSQSFKIFWSTAWELSNRNLQYSWICNSKR